MEIKYHNSVEKSVEPIMNALQKTPNFTNMVKRRRTIFAFVGIVALMYFADLYLKYRSPAMLMGLIFVAAICGGVILGFRKIYASSCRKKIVKSLSETDSLSAERIFRFNDKGIEIGSEKYAKKYPVEKLDFCYEDSDHLVIGLKNGAVAAIGREFFSSEKQFNDVIAQLNRQIESNEKL